MVRHRRCVDRITSIGKMHSNTTFNYKMAKIQSKHNYVGINYRRISLRPVTRPDSVWFLPVGFRQGQCLHPATSRDTTRIARAHQHRNRERHTRHAWEGLGGNGSIAWTSAVSHVGRTSNAFKVTMKLQTFIFQMVATSCISVQYLWKYGFAKSSGNLYAPCILAMREWIT